MGRYPFGPWTPDLNSFLVQGAGLTVARNVLPSEDGYTPLPSLEPVSPYVLPFRPKSALRVLTSSGVNEFFAGVDDASGPTPVARIYRLTDAGWADVSNAVPYQRLGQERWGFAQFGLFVIACQRGAQTQVYEVGRSSTFEPIRGHVPRAAHTAVSRRFIWLGDIVDPIQGVMRNGVCWGPIGRANDWLPFGTDDAAQVQSDLTELDGNGGAVQAVVTGKQVVAIFQENAIHRADYVGGNVVWSINQVDPETGLHIKDAACGYPGGVLFIAEDGFRVFNYSGSVNIGKGRINNWFFTDYDSTYPDSVTLARDPGSTRIFISYAGQGNVDGLPNRTIVWDWVLDRFSYGDVSHSCVVQASNVELSLDSPGSATDPDLLGDSEAFGLDSFDDRPPGLLNPLIGAFDSELRLCRFSGVGYPAVLETGDIELEPGFRSMLNGVAPNIGSDELTMQCGGLDNRNDQNPVVEWGPVVELEETGLVPFHDDWRYHRLRFNLGRSFTPATAYDTESKRTGRR